MTSAEPEAGLETDVSHDDLVRHWTVVLAEYWRQTDWEQFPDQKRRSESFEERLLSAQNAGDVHGALKKLARGLGMATPELPTANLGPLVANSEAAMRVLRREDIWLVAKANETVQNYFDGMDDAGAEPEPTTSTLSDFLTTEEEDD